MSNPTEPPQAVFIWQEVQTFALDRHPFRNLSISGLTFLFVATFQVPICFVSSSSVSFLLSLVNGSGGRSIALLQNASGYPDTARGRFITDLILKKTFDQESKYRTKHKCRHQQNSHKTADRATAARDFVQVTSSRATPAQLPAHLAYLRV